LRGGLPVVNRLLKNGEIFFFQRGLHGVHQRVEKRALFIRIKILDPGKDLSEAWR